MGFLLFSCFLFNGIFIWYNFRFTEKWWRIQLIAKEKTKKNKCKFLDVLFYMCSLYGGHKEIYAYLEERRKMQKKSIFDSIIENEWQKKHTCYKNDTPLKDSYFTFT